MDKETYEFQAVQESLRNDTAVNLIMEMLNDSKSCEGMTVKLQEIIRSLKWESNNSSYQDKEKVMTCREVCDGIKAAISEEFINRSKMISDRYNTEWQRMIAFAVLVSDLISSLDWESKPPRKIALTYSKQPLMTCSEICDRIISAIDYELEKPIKEEIHSEMVETMKDDFDPEKASEITFKHFEKAYPGFERFFKEQIGEE